MEIWESFRILKKSNKPWFLKVHDGEKIKALNHIQINGYPSNIPYLIHLLLDRNDKIRQHSYSIIHHLLAKVQSKKEYYHVLKHCDISRKDIDRYEKLFSKQQYLELLAICSNNHSGYVREKAVKKLSELDLPEAIEYLIYRLSDWVIPVRQAALEGIRKFKKSEYLKQFIYNLPNIEWLLKVERVNQKQVYEELIAFIFSIHRSQLLTNFKRYPDKLRFLIAKQISNTLNNDQNELNVLLRDRHFLIRDLITNHFDILSTKEINLLLNDHSGKIRLKTLYYMKDTEDIERTVIPFLADTSATIREFARYTLKDQDIDLHSHYWTNLTEKNQIIGSLRGLSEVGTEKDATVIKAFLVDNKIRIRKTAFMALSKLDQEESYLFALENLGTPYSGLRNLIIHQLSQFDRNAVLERARDIYQTGDFDLKKSMLKLFNQIGGWKTIPDIMIGTIDENSVIRQISFDYLQIWRNKAIRLFTYPTQTELDRAKQTFELVHETHEDKKFFTPNPVSDLGFYFQ